MVALLLPVVVDVGGNGSAERRSADVCVFPTPNPENFVQGSSNSMAEIKIEKSQPCACKGDPD